MKLIGQIEQVLFQRVKTLDELFALLVGEKGANQDQTTRDLIATWIAAATPSSRSTLPFFPVTSAMMTSAVWI
jgi:hypothetical protein